MRSRREDGHAGLAADPRTTEQLEYDLLMDVRRAALHNRGWRIGREAKGRFILYPPPGEGSPIVLASKAPWKWAWDPPPPPERLAWRATGARIGKQVLSA